MAIETRGLSKSYGALAALAPLHLSVPDRSIFGFLGPNGAGKSTTIKLLLGLIRPTGGAGQVFGRDIVRDSIELRRQVGYLPQSPRFYDHMTARETLDFAARFFYRGPGPAVARRVAESLELVGLADKADRPVKSFSGGERQRLGIAQAQIHRPRLLILDEPAAALDPLGRHDVLQIMAGLRAQSTIFFSTHILDDVQRVSDYVAILNRGRLVAHAPIGQLLAAGGRTVYSVAVCGDDTAARRSVAAQPWVAELKAAPENGYSRWEVAVTNAEAADAELLPLVLAGGGCRVLEYGRKQQDLEQVFLSLVGGNANGR
jgi:ABC-2 type transport system ATP-binding protein